MWLTFRWALFLALTLCGLGFKMLISASEMVMRIAIPFTALAIIAVLLVKPAVILGIVWKIVLVFVFYAALASLCLWLASKVRPKPGDWSRCFEAKQALRSIKPSVESENSVTVEFVDGKWQ
jgi:hypothetical protein